MNRGNETEKATSTPKILESKKYKESFFIFMLDSIQEIENAVIPLIKVANRQTLDNNWTPETDNIQPSLRKQPKLTNVNIEDKKAPIKISTRPNLSTILVFQTIQA